MHEHLKSEAPLATQMRPRTLDEYICQEHIVGEGKLLRRTIEADKLFFELFFGTPDTGRTMLAQVIPATIQWVGGAIAFANAGGNSQRLIHAGLEIHPIQIYTIFHTSNTTHLRRNPCN